MACSENMFFLIGLFMSGVLACFGQRDLIASMPDRLDVLTGSCVQIPCSFDIPDKHKDTFNSAILLSGVWIKEFPYLDLPSSPILTVSGEVKEGTPVSLNCSAVAPCPEHPPELTWTLPTQFTTENQLQENPDQTKSVLSTVTFTPSYLHHEKNITCTAVYPVGTSNKRAEHNMTLNVSFSPKDTSASISPDDPVFVGSCVNLTCSSTANPPVTNFTWFKISEGKTTQVASGQSYTLNVTVGDGGLYYCQARNSHGCGMSNEVQLAIKGHEEPVNPKVFEIVGKTLGLIFLFSLIVFFAWRRRTSRLPSGFDMTDRSQGLVGMNSPVGTVCSNQATVGRGNQ
ncbi:vascular cell adhesion protein 1-like isoform X2 [Oncorhynchus kisutch]|uniref:vascular cell adhesion protein 1-like isoform X2 n=1 Tax=Oncorhynchus kisutch TaxID=8019 RepID=UPI0012DC5C91|nr:vascular cell adhesion protein 1-like isoform X2 [Oncorhynchus kisutch]